MFKRALMFSAIAIALIQTAPGFALFLLDDVMSKEMQQKTGVATLNPNQKKVLESWLNQTFELRTTQEVKEPALFLSINIDAGQKLQLSDGSLWEVSPLDVAQASVWITPFPIRIIPGSDPNYPYLLVNKISGISINARPISSPTGTTTPPGGSVIVPGEQAPPPGGQVINPATETPAPQGEQPTPQAGMNPSSTGTNQSPAPQGGQKP